MLYNKVFSRIRKLIGKIYDRFYFMGWLKFYFWILLFSNLYYSKKENLFFNIFFIFID